MEDGLEGLTEKQTKLASYWNTPFNKLCLGMKANGVTKWMVVDHQATSLFNQIADGGFQATSVGKNRWKSLVDRSYLQENCNMEGFNFQRVWNPYHIKTRIGFVGNTENNCDSPDTCIGFGISAAGSCGVANITCGYLIFCGGNAAFGFVLVQ
jgi:hypothetical protein